jgi:tRNA G18 (ribose-2'-O)-methylase SpoU
MISATFRPGPASGRRSVMSCIPVRDLADPRLDAYRNLRDATLRARHGLFVAEGRLVVRRLLQSSWYRTVSVLVTEPARRSLADALELQAEDLAVFVAPPSLLQAITGVNVHRGCLAVGARATEAGDLAAALAAPGSPARRLLVLERMGNADNVGSVFRSARAFGVDAVLLGPGCCDPLYRKAMRVSMGAALSVPFGIVEPWPRGLDRLRTAGFRLVALTPDAAAGDLEWYAARPGRPQRLALLLGAEGDGLSGEALAAADLRLRIPMASGIDSLNVAVAAAIALYRLAARDGVPGSTALRQARRVSSLPADEAGEEG